MSVFAERQDLHEALITFGISVALHAAACERLRGVARAELKEATAARQKLEQAMTHAATKVTEQYLRVYGAPGHDRHQPATAASTA